MEEKTQPHGLVRTSCFGPGVHMCSYEPQVSGSVLVCLAAVHLLFVFITAVLIQVRPSPVRYENRYIFGVHHL